MCECVCARASLLYAELCSHTHRDHCMRVCMRANVWLPYIYTIQYMCVCCWPRMTGYRNYKMLSTRNNTDNSKMIILTLRLWFTMYGHTPFIHKCIYAYAFKIVQAWLAISRLIVMLSSSSLSSLSPLNTIVVANAFMFAVTLWYSDFFYFCALWLSLFVMHKSMRRSSFCHTYNNTYAFLMPVGVIITRMSIQKLLIFNLIFTSNDNKCLGVDGFLCCRCCSCKIFHQLPLPSLWLSMRLKSSQSNVNHKYICNA